jgi:hypothetical protein
LEIISKRFFRQLRYSITVLKIKVFEFFRFLIGKVSRKPSSGNYLKPLPSTAALLDNRSQSKGFRVFSATAEKVSRKPSSGSYLKTFLSTAPLLDNRSQNKGFRVFSIFNRKSIEKTAVWKLSQNVSFDSFATR